MRIRQIKPEFWKDAKVADLPEGARLFFIGTWQLADDAGWIRWDVPTIAAELFPFEGRRARERRVERYAADLVAGGVLRIGECGHALIPRLPTHQHLAGTTRRVLSVWTEHSEKCPRPSATIRDDPRFPASVGIGSYTRARAREDAGGSERNGAEPFPEFADLDAAIAANRAILDDPKAAAVAKRAAKRELERLGAEVPGVDYGINAGDRLIDRASKGRRDG